MPSRALAMGLLALLAPLPHLFNTSAAADWPPGLFLLLEFKPEVSLGEVVFLKLIVENRGDEPITLNLGACRTGPGHGIEVEPGFYAMIAHDLIVTTPSGAILWGWWPWLLQGGACAGVGIRLTLKPSDGLELVGTWELVDRFGGIVPPGIYYIYGVLLDVIFSPDEMPRELWTRARKLVVRDGRFLAASCLKLYPGPCIS